MSDSVWPHRRQPTRLCCPWYSPGKNTGVGCHLLLQCMQWKVKAKSLSCVWLFATPWTAAHQAPPSKGFSRQEYWSGLPLPSPTSEWWSFNLTLAFAGVTAQPTCFPCLVLLWGLRTQYSSGMAPTLQEVPKHQWDRFLCNPNPWL